MEKSRQSNYQGNSMRGGRVRIQTSLLTRQFNYEWSVADELLPPIHSTWLKRNSLIDLSHLLHLPAARSVYCITVSGIWFLSKLFCLKNAQLLLNQIYSAVTSMAWWMMQRTSTGVRRGLSPINTIGMCITLGQGLLVTEFYSCCICHVLHIFTLVRNHTYTVLAKRRLPTATC